MDRNIFLGLVASISTLQGCSAQPDLENIHARNFSLVMAEGALENETLAQFNDRTNPVKAYHNFVAAFPKCCTVKTEDEFFSPSLSASSKRTNDFFRNLLGMRSYVYTITVGKDHYYIQRICNETEACSKLDD